MKMKNCLFYLLQQFVIYGFHTKKKRMQILNN